MPAIRVLTDLVAEQLAHNVADLVGGAGEPGNEVGQNWNDLVELGVPAFAVPVDADGLDLGQAAAIIVAEELGKVATGRRYLDGTLLTEMLANTGAGGPLHNSSHGTACRIERLRRLADGRTHARAVAITGTAPVAKPDGEGWTLPANVLPEIPETVDTLLIRFEAEGTTLIAVAEPCRHGTPVHVTRAGVLAEPELPTSLRDRARLRHAANLLGAAVAAVDLTIDRATERRQFGVSLATYQAVAFPLAALCARVDAARLFVEHTAWQQDKGQLDPGNAATALGMAIELAHDAVQQCVHTHGAAGLVQHSLLDRLRRLVLGEASRWGPAEFLWREAGTAWSSVTLAEPAAHEGVGQR
ncbi:MAG: acyl-CoA dehydrogenase family protein [Nocardioides sp.]|uniref:acyl-CoA dehydrogenase family protein n=1 Tax=Nocardioides sp. TaxID=35761 RepID=UPI0039E2CDE9